MSPTDTELLRNISRKILRPTKKTLRKYIKNKIKCGKDDQAIFTEPDDLPKTVVAIGDIHGDLEALFLILLDASIIDINGNWIAHNTFVVQTGDIFDKGRIFPKPLASVGVPQILSNGTHNTDFSVNNIKPYNIINDEGETVTLSHESGVNYMKKIGSAKQQVSHYNFKWGNVGDELVILHFLTDLNDQATSGKFGKSRILLCCGNHEIMNVLDFDNILEKEYAHPMDAELFGSDFKMRKNMLKPGGILAQKFSCILKVVVIVGDFIFLHGGMNRINMAKITTIDDINDINTLLRKYLIGETMNSVEKDDIQTYFVSIENSLLWDRSVGEKMVRDMNCADILSIFSTKLQNPNFNMVIGHTIQGDCNDDPPPGIASVRFQYDRKDVKGNIVKRCTTLPTTACKNRVYRIDTGITRSQGAADYRNPVYGRLNSLRIELYRDGSKKNVSIYNHLLGKRKL
jgi:hypothetical protein